MYMYVFFEVHEAIYLVFTKYYKMLENYRTKFQTDDRNPPGPKGEND